MTPPITIPESNADIKTLRPQPSATIIVATTSSMGMSWNTHLPWPKLRRENTYFENTTKRTVSPGVMNAVIMGYNTWDDEPTKRFAGRINVVVTRMPEKVHARLEGDAREGWVHVVTSLYGAVELLGRLYSPPFEGCVATLSRPQLGRVFIIGGAELCKEALRLDWVDRLLLTRVECEVKTDTVFPLKIGADGGGPWKRQSDLEFREWAGPETPIGLQCEDGIRWEAFMFKRILGEGSSTT